MKKILSFSIFYIFLIISPVFGSQFYYKTNYISEKEKLMNGPVLTRVKRFTTHKDYVFLIKADSVYFEKQKIGFFKTALIKKLKADKVYVDFKKNKETKLSFKAQNGYFSMDLKKISIKSPKLIYPENLKNPEKIIIDFNKKISLIYKNKVEEFAF